MIAIVSSTIKPLTGPQQSKSFYTYEQRVEQTKFTLLRLRECGFTKIFLIDNSPLLDKEQIQKLLTGFPEVEVHHLLQYQFKNKGINELLLLLYLIEYLPANQPVFKISGRYYPTQDFKKPDFADLAVKKYHHSRNNNSISTRGYWVKDADTLHRFLTDCLYEHFVYSERIVGLGSLIRVLFRKKDKNTPHFSISIEFAAERVLRKGDYDVTFIDKIGIEGLIAGAENVEKITE
ncbi:MULTISPECIES: hypothetical protein [unclassified Mucilaginibacter]|uniref:hypothetical protein n=1 Tax=unclassified Mucilaginibacter TaxID=2617802 RepID=UPI002AC9041D|nr:MULTISPECIES: hypothetical protein [unclassified Mucilaginibacter]MEB0260638.1 hypothetical protein [Mucilaginibacter sp. 10I4]MEB0277477.1 hypothetical protein [Mucilaginibacter sp. 10B2]MEB0302324.1 hypothetical protein [Mucilaginibacter sp. 5C4]WPX24893.1 hypothetical protein RHM67_06390 [Mucilaginibacter sp. 5C4]